MSALEDLRWKRFPVLDQGFVCLVDVMGSDRAVMEAARKSYAPSEKVDDYSDAKVRGLLRHMMREGHTSPFEQAEIKLLVRVPMDTWRQWIRHRTANVNEYSTRYSEAIDAAQTTPTNCWRTQAQGNKQGSGDYIGMYDEFPDALADQRPEDCSGLGIFLSGQEYELQEHAREVYETRLAAGVAREQARKDLPLSTYTEAYWKNDLHNTLKFLSLRMDGHAQQEIRAYATVIGEEIVAKLFPLTWEAFNDYDPRRGGMLLSRLEIEIIRAYLSGQPFNIAATFAEVGWPPISKPCRERDDCVAKMKRLGFVEMNP